MHTVKTQIVLDAAGVITGYGLTVEAATSGDPEEIQAAIAASLEMIRAAIVSQIVAQTDPPPTHAPAEPLTTAQATPGAAPSQNGHPQPPKTALEAEQRFFARYGAIVGGQSWKNVQTYLGSRLPRPTNIKGWIAAAETVRDKAQAQPRA